MGGTRILAGLGAAVVIAALSLPARAADLGGGEVPYKTEPLPEALPYFNPWYAGIRGGAAFTGDSEFDALGTGFDSTYGTGTYFSGLVGYDFSSIRGRPGFRGELELGLLQNDIDAHGVNGLGGFSGSNAFGSASALVGLASLYYDLPFSPGITPFLGGGIGFADVSFSDQGVAPLGTVMDDSATGFAWHLTSGFEFQIAERTSFELGYRYLAIQGIDLQAVDGTDTSADLDSHIVFAGIKYRF